MHLPTRSGVRTMRLYRIMDRLLDPLPKELRQSSDQASKMLYYETQDEGYRRYKHLQYRNLILEALLCFLLGLFAHFFLVR